MNTKSNSHLLNCRGRLIDVSNPLIMGILNLTPDSFYDGGKYSTPDLQAEKISGMLNDGMDILDIGAYSSRPGAEDISLEEEWSRLSPLLDIVSKKYGDLLVSIDTFRSEIARRAVQDYGVSMINDISGFSFDGSMPDTIAELQVPYILMHMQGNPLTMQDNPSYNNLLSDIMSFFLERIKILRESGVKDIIIDPGFGFGKTLDQNYELLSRLDQLQIFDLPVLAGLSRKSMIYKLLDQEPSDALSGTIVLQVIALQKGAKILRAHDIKEAVVCRKLIEKVNQSNI
jgi:dihydropteroate synthase